MDCRETQERLLESLEGWLSPLEQRHVQEHVSACPDCARFAAQQRQLDLRLRETITATQLGPSFRAALRSRIAREQREPWPDWLPDVAYLAGSGLAISTCALLLPVPVPVVLESGVALAFLAYALQTLLVSTLGQKSE
jgi:anti-sigma factor RsiW